MGGFHATRPRPTVIGLLLAAVFFVLCLATATPWAGLLLAWLLALGVRGLVLLASRPTTFAGLMMVGLCTGLIGTSLAVLTPAPPPDAGIIAIPQRVTPAEAATRKPPPAHGTP